LIKGFPLASLRDYASSSHSNDANQVARQSAKVNRGFTSSMPMAQQAGNGVPTPHLKQDSLDQVVVNSHDKATSILQKVSLPWLGRPIVADQAHIGGFTDQISPQETPWKAACSPLGLPTPGIVTHTIHHRPNMI
jgi:hypothetical protein